MTKMATIGIRDDNNGDTIKTCIFSHDNSLILGSSLGSL
jgi:hypothetical protein